MHILCNFLVFYFKYSFYFFNLFIYQFPISNPFVLCCCEHIRWQTVIQYHMIALLWSRAKLAVCPWITSFVGAPSPSGVPHSGAWLSPPHSPCLEYDSVMRMKCEPHPTRSDFNSFFLLIGLFTEGKSSIWLSFDLCPPTEKPVASSAVGDLLFLLTTFLCEKQAGTIGSNVSERKGSRTIRQKAWG